MPSTPVREEDILYFGLDVHRRELRMVIERIPHVEFLIKSVEFPPPSDVDSRIKAESYYPIVCFSSKNHYMELLDAASDVSSKDMCEWRL